MIANTGKILDPTAPDQDHRMLLQIMTDPGDI
jgi:hypothetical protein